MNRFSSLANRVLDARMLPLAVTIILFVGLFSFGGLMYTGFFSLQVLLDLLVDNAFLLIVAIGMTFVIVSGGIDLSVGSVVALTTILEAVMVQHFHWSVWVIIPIVLAVGALFGAAMGWLIHHFRLQPFVITLAGMFLARGLCFLISIDSITITDPTFSAISGFRIALGSGSVSANVLIALAMMAVAIYIAHGTRFGRNVYAIGGNERSALLMGLPVARTKVLVYTFSGFCSALAGVVFTFYVLSGYGLQAQGMELDAIAATVIGGTLLTGGVGYVIGSLFGVGILGTIQSLITFDGTLSSWWTRIVIGALLCIFCLLQRLLERRTHRAGRAEPPAANTAAARPSVLKQGASANPAGRMQSGFYKFKPYFPRIFRMNQATRSDQRDVAPQGSAPGVFYPALEDRTVFITGGASGIGAQLVEDFAAQGARVGFVDIDESSAQSLLERLGAVRHRPEFIRCDITDVGALQGAIATVRDRFGPVGVLLNNAANDKRHAVEATTSASWDTGIAVNLKAQFFAAQAVLDDMKQLGGGSIVNFGSISWMLKQGGMPVYTTSKAAVHGLTRSLARDFGPYRIRVNTLVPGWVMTDKQLALWVDQQAKEEIKKGQCIDQPLLPEHIAQMALFLASEQSCMCTAQQFVVDGGWV